MSSPNSPSPKSSAARSRAYSLAAISWPASATPDEPQFHPGISASGDRPPRSAQPARRRSGAKRSPAAYPVRCRRATFFQRQVEPLYCAAHTAPAVRCRCHAAARDDPALLGPAAAQLVQRQLRLLGQQLSDQVVTFRQRPRRTCLVRLRRALARSESRPTLFSVCASTCASRQRGCSQ